MTRAELERRIRERFDADDLAAAASLAIEGYGGEVCGYLAAIVSDPEQARDVFADTQVEMWRDLSRFRWESSFRTWLYTLARHRLHAHLQRNGRRRTVPLSEAPEIAARNVVERTPTPPWRRTDVKERATRLRQSLSPGDQELLILRVDRDLSWREIACILGQQAPALRQRFQRLKHRFRPTVTAD